MTSKQFPKLAYRLRKEAEDQKRVRKNPLKVTLSYFEKTLVVIASLCAIFGVWSWTNEATDRSEERSIRRLNLEEKAIDLISSANKDGVILTTPKLQWAIRTMAYLDKPITLTADFIYLLDADLECADITVSALSIMIMDNHISNSRLTLSAPSILLTPTSIENSYVQMLSLEIKNNIRDSYYHFQGKASDTTLFFLNDSYSFKLEEESSNNFLQVTGRYSDIFSAAKDERFVHNFPVFIPTNQIDEKLNGLLIKSDSKVDHSNRIWDLWKQIEKNIDEPDSYEFVDMSLNHRYISVQTKENKLPNFFLFEDNDLSKEFVKVCNETSCLNKINSSRPEPSRIQRCSRYRNTLLRQ